MRFDALIPQPVAVEPFRRDRAKFVPNDSGCYALTTATGHVLYVGLARHLDVRMVQHLDNPEKTRLTTEGRAVNFRWLIADNIEAVERGWLNMHLALYGKLPLLNKLASPVSY